MKQEDDSAERRFPPTGPPYEIGHVTNRRAVKIYWTDGSLLWQGTAKFQYNGWDEDGDRPRLAILDPVPMPDEAQQAGLADMAGNPVRVETAPLTAEAPL